MGRGEEETKIAGPFQTEYERGPEDKLFEFDRSSSD